MILFIIDIYLIVSNTRWQNKTVIVTMNHSQDTNSTSCETPRVLIDVLFLTSLWSLELNAEHLGEVLSQVMRCSCLNSSSTCAYVRLNSRGPISPSELFFLGLSAFDYWHCQQVSVDFGIQVEDLIDLLFSQHLVFSQYSDIDKKD